MKNRICPECGIELGPMDYHACELPLVKKEIEGLREELAAARAERDRFAEALRDLDYLPWDSWQCYCPMCQYQSGNLETSKRHAPDCAKAEAEKEGE